MSQLESNMDIFGPKFKEIYTAIKTLLESFEGDMDKILKGVIIDSSEGDDLDRLGEFFSVNRNSNESDYDYRVRINSIIDYLLTHSITGDGLLNLVQDISGLTPTIIEYPDMDFTYRTGKPGPGLLIRFDQNDIRNNPEDISILKKSIDKFKPAGVPTAINTILPFANDYVNILNDLLEASAFREMFESLEPVIPNSEWDVYNWGESSFDVPHYIYDKFISFFGMRFFDELITIISNIYINMTRNMFNELINNYNDDQRRFIVNFFQSVIKHGFDNNAVWDESIWNQKVDIEDNLSYSGTLKYSEVIIPMITNIQIIGGLFGNFVDPLNPAQLSDTIFMDGTINFSESSPSPFETFVGFILRYLSETYSGPISDIFNGYINGLFTDFHSGYNDAMNKIKINFIDESDTNGWDINTWDISRFGGYYIRDLFFGVLKKYLQENITVYSDIILGAMKGTFTELFNSVTDTIAKFGNLIFSDRIENGWDQAKWDQSYFETIIKDIIKLSYTLTYLETLVSFTTDTIKWSAVMNINEQIVNIIPTILYFLHSYYQEIVNVSSISLSGSMIYYKLQVVTQLLDTILGKLKFFASDSVSTVLSDLSKLTVNILEYLSGYDTSKWDISKFGGDVIDIFKALFTYPLSELLNESNITAQLFESLIKGYMFDSFNIYTDSLDFSALWQEIISNVNDTIFFDGILKYTENVIAIITNIKIQGDILYYILDILNAVQFKDTIKLFGTLSLPEGNPERWFGWDQVEWDNHWFDLPLDDILELFALIPLSDNVTSVVDQLFNSLTRFFSVIYSGSLTDILDFVGQLMFSELINQSSVSDIIFGSISGSLSENSNIHNDLIKGFITYYQNQLVSIITAQIKLFGTKSFGTQSISTLVDTFGKNILDQVNAILENPFTGTTISSSTFLNPSVWDGSSFKIGLDRIGSAFVEIGNSTWDVALWDRGYTLVIQESYN